MNVLFDLDGTLTDSRHGIVACIKHALATLEQPCPDDSEFQRFIGPPLRLTFMELFATRDDDTRIDAAIAAYRERFTSVGMFENDVYEGIPQTLMKLSARDVRMYVATSKPRVFAERILEHFGLAQFFDAIYGSELDGRLTDKGELIAHALSTSALRAADTIMIGDRSHDIIGALKNGVFPAGALWGYGSRQELTAAGAKRLLERCDDVLHLVS